MEIKSVNVTYYCPLVEKNISAKESSKPNSEPCELTYASEISVIIMSPMYTVYTLLELWQAAMVWKLCYVVSDEAHR